jgi:hypothetical protein
MELCSAKDFWVLYFEMPNPVIWSMQCGSTDKRLKIRGEKKIVVITRNKADMRFALWCWFMDISFMLVRGSEICNKTIRNWPLRLC